MSSKNFILCIETSLSLYVWYSNRVFKRTILLIGTRVLPPVKKWTIFAVIWICCVLAMLCCLDYNNFKVVWCWVRTIFTIDYRGHDYTIYGCVCGQLVVRNITSKLCRSNIVLVKGIARTYKNPTCLIEQCITHPSLTLWLKTWY